MHASRPFSDERDGTGVEGQRTLCKVQGRYTRVSSTLPGDGESPRQSSQCQGGDLYTRDPLLGVPSSVLSRPRCPRPHHLSQPPCGVTLLDIPRLFLLSASAYFVIHLPAVYAPLMQELSILEAHVPMLHAYRLIYLGSPHAPEMLWEWEKVSIARLLWNATAFGRELAHCYFPSWEALAQENQRIWETYYLPRPLYQPWATCQAWLAEYREIVRDVEEMAEEHYGRSGKATR